MRFFPSSPLEFASPDLSRSTGELIALAETITMGASTTKSVFFFLLAVSRTSPVTRFIFPTFSIRSARESQKTVAPAFTASGMYVNATESFASNGHPSPHAPDRRQSREFLPFAFVLYPSARAPSSMIRLFGLWFSSGSG